MNYELKLAALQFELGELLGPDATILRDADSLCVRVPEYGPAMYVTLGYSAIESDEDEDFARLTFGAQVPPNVAAELAVAVDGLMPTYIDPELFHHSYRTTIA